MNKSAAEETTIPKISVGIDGFDQITEGGIPKGRTTLVAGTSGSGKTFLALQYLVGGATQFGDNGVIVTFEETPEEIMRNVQSLGWDMKKLVKDKKIAFVDCSPEPGETIVESGVYDFSALMARIEHAVRSVNGKRVIMDSIGSVFSQFTDRNLVRNELHRIASGLRALEVTSLITVERVDEYGDIARFGVEEFVSDNVIILRNPLDNEKRRRTIEILKFRGTTHQKGEFPFSIDPVDGMIIIPLSAMELEQRSSTVRIHSGNKKLDEMCGGGMFRDSIVLVSGATGTGKTLMATQFAHAGITSGQKVIYFAFEESREQLMRNAEAWSFKFGSAEKDGLLKIICRYPESMGLEDHLINIKRDIEGFKPVYIACDSLSALERVSSVRSFREFVIGLTSHIKHNEMAGMFTNTTSMLMGGESITETHVSTITDSIVLLRYVELQGEMRRGITVLKMRGSRHDKQIREYAVNDTGMHIGEPFRGVSGIISGAPSYSVGEESVRLSELFNEGGE